ncbi:type-F conjugative transfer system pilin assembly protein TraF [Vibrio parahaemolyticus]|nr:type-F conjugative transfer system pilin assembly protein TraF [Vibrio parahaemolyticus]MDF5595858.1 type-F conjugative transfer system pilin assembly protein TraF [Vibrio parahaemolyticus]
MKLFFQQQFQASSKKLLSLALLSLFTSNSIANETPHGWRWYNEPKAVPEKKETPKSIPQNTVTTVMSATQQMEWFHQTFEEAVNDSTINPTDEDKYLTVMKLKHFIEQKTAQTGMTHKKLLLEHPEYSYIKDRPVEQAARGTYYALERDKKIQAVKQMKDEGWGFFFVYNGTDKLSQTLAPSIQEFANNHQIELLGISEDGTFIEAVNNNRANDGRVVVPYAPALILVNPKTSEFKPLAYGFISQNDLLSRFYNVATDYATPDF